MADYSDPFAPAAWRDDDGTLHLITGDVDDAAAVDALNPPAGTVAEILAWVDDDPGRARLAYQAEHETHSTPRVTLLDALELVIDSDDAESPTEPADGFSGTDEPGEPAEPTDDADGV